MDVRKEMLEEQWTAIFLLRLADACGVDSVFTSCATVTILWIVIVTDFNK